MNYNVEQLVLRNLLTNEPYLRKVLPFIKPDYFAGVYKQLFLSIGKYVAEYNHLPTEEAFKITIDENSKLNDEQYTHAMEILPHIFKKDSKLDEKWLLDKTEKWCQDRAIHNSVMESITIIDGKHASLTKNAIPDLLQKALAVTFDTQVGHDYIENAEDRYEFYHEQEERIPFDLDYFNRITKGGVPNKTLNIALAGTGVGKSLFMCHVAASCLTQGRNVLYITLEMAEERIAERLDANLLDVTMEDLAVLPKSSYQKKMKRLMETCTGKIVIKEYPTASANANHFRHLLQELRTKKNFKPDVIYIDYLNICASFRIRGGANAGSYAIVKAIAEELRGLAVEFNVPIISATQTNRAGFSSSDIGLEDTSESFGLPATADFMLAISQTEELEQLNQYMVKQLKNRYADPSFHRRFVVGVDKSKMRLFDVEQSAQKELVDDTPLFDRSQDKPNKDLKSLFDDFK